MWYKKIFERLGFDICEVVKHPISASLLPFIERGYVMDSESITISGMELIGFNPKTYADKLMESTHTGPDIGDHRTTVINHGKK